MIYDAVIIGGGAAGLFCAITAGRRGKRVVVLEHNAEVGRKIVISGGGRCNFTNLNVSSENFVSQNPHFAKSALAGFTPNDFIDLVKAHGIEYYEKKLGQLFCRTSSRQIIGMLLAECRRAGVEIRTGCSVSSVRTRDSGFTVRAGESDVAAHNLVVACGGLSFPKVGASDLGYRLAKQFGLKIEPTRPSLVGLMLEKGPVTKLAGISVDAAVSTRKRSFRENILFTHRGLSGPAILQISNYWTRGDAVLIDMAPDGDLERTIGDGKRTVGNLLSSKLPMRLIDQLLGRDLAGRKVAELSKSDKKETLDRLRRWDVKFHETEGWDRAEVTLGGVATSELVSKSMEAKKVPGLYFIGEVVDVTGWLGGYNFQWAWASGFAAGKAI